VATNGVWAYDTQEGSWEALYDDSAGEYGESSACASAFSPVATALYQSDAAAPCDSPRGWNVPCPRYASMAAVRLVCQRNTTRDALSLAGTTPGW